MVHSYPCYRYLIACCSLLLLHACTAITYGQLPAGKLHSGIPDSIPIPEKDTLKKQLTFAGSRLLKRTKDSLKNVIEVDVNNPFDKLFITRPAFRLNGGMIGYVGNYRSIIDTPYAEKGIIQHNITGRWDITLANIFPLQINYRVRQSNSSFFRNIYDVQASFNQAAFQNSIKSSLRTRMLALAPTIKDTLLEKLYTLKQADLTGLANQLKTIFSEQKLIAANETLKVPKLTWDNSLPDSLNLSREDSFKRKATDFLNQYADTKKRYDSLHAQVDSLKDKYEANLKKVKQYQQMINGDWSQLQSVRAWKNKFREYGMDNMEVPAKYRWLLGIRNFSLGRSPVNYSELTAKNVSINGINVEYNSWYYFALTAGSVNYRFRDFVVANKNRKPQYLAMVRAGIGRLEKDFFILSAFKGQKQLFATGAAVNSTIHITGFSAESRWAINRTTWLTAEVAKSITPDYRNNPSLGGNKFVLKDKNNQAIALRLNSTIPLTRSRVEAFFKQTGANYQSFGSYTTNSAMESWYIKADQNLFKRQLRIAGSLRKNEFSNPFLVQDYKSNTVFKSLSATVRVRRWPVVTVGYQPMSQYTKVDEVVIENRFQTVNATLFHLYPVRQLKMATTIMVNKFYNNQADTGFLYYNATNSYFTQTFYFKTFTANAGISFTKNSNYTLQVMDGGIQPNIPRFGTIGFGIRINNLNNTVIKAGGYVSANIRLFKRDLLFINYEHGYLPGNKHGLVRNEMGTIQFVKTFNFR
ncbi:hypothetical protein [Niastella populi]|uniref:Outer membrane protein beta-barrel domain-containing protein n=1 Tax=Niastella populi TaxID=550983 RepID=A0A1V9GCR7_9BACT|nr:hypothetical protein [Niastella populi]OQP68403.1 hypothetical protein A4R26_00930 [Niastella populi]